MGDLELTWKELEKIEELDDELDEIIKEIDLDLEVSEARSTSNAPCSLSYNLNGFAYTVSSLTSFQRNLVARVARDILTAIAKVKEVKITGYASGTRRLELHATRRAKSVFDELKKQLRGLGANEEDIAKISFGAPVTKPVSSQAASDPKFRKVEICVINKTRPVKPKPPKIIELIRTAPIGTLGKGKWEQSRLFCLREQLARAFGGVPIDDRYWLFFIQNNKDMLKPCSMVGQDAPIAIHKKRVPRRAMQVFESMVGSSNDPVDVARSIKRLHDDIFCQINALRYYIHNFGDTPRDARIGSTECVEARLLIKQSKKTRPESIYKCFSSLLEDFFNDHCSLD